MKKQKKTVVRRRVPFVFGTRNRPAGDKFRIGFAADSSNGVIHTFIYFRGEGRVIGFHYKASNHETIHHLFAGYGECLSSFTHEEEELLKEQYSVARKKRARYFKTHPEKA